MRLLLVEDDKESRTFLQRGLAGEGFAVDVAADIEAALALARRVAYDAVLMHAHQNHPDLSMVSLLRKELPSAVIILMHGQALERDQLEAFYHGADDVVRKPSLREIVTRLRVRLRRPPAIESVISNPNELLLGQLRMNLLTRRVWCSGKEVRLTKKESELLEFLMRHPDHVLSSQVIRQELWSIEVDVDSNVVERHVCSLRRKLGPAGHRIETLRGYGYRLAA